MKRLPLIAGSIPLVWAAVILLVGAVLAVGYRRTTGDLNHLMEEEAYRLIDVVTVAAAGGIHALDEVESLTEERLRQNARLIERLAARGGITSDTLESIVREHELSAAMIVGIHHDTITAGERVPQHSVDSELDSLTEGVMHRVTGGESAEEPLGFDAEGYDAGNTYGVMVHRRGGGAVAVWTDDSRMNEFRRVVGLGRLLRELGEQEGIRYIVLQDTLGIIAASPGVDAMTRILDDPFLQNLTAGERRSRRTEENGYSVLEVVTPLIVDDVDLGLLRVGLATQSIDAVRARTLREYFLLGIAAAISGAVVLLFIMLRQNYRMLNREHDRMMAEVRRMEEASRRAERLSSMGRLAAGVAHEIRNPLNAVSIISQRLRAEFRPREQAEEYDRFLGTIAGEISRISTIIEQFLAAARPPQLAPVETGFDEILRSVEQVVGEQARAQGVNLTIDARSPLPCRCDPDQMKQALLNIILNAFEALDGPGEVVVRAATRGDAIVCTVQDSGPGIPATVAPVVFDPFVTTKERGTGLGLSEVHRIITAHGGSVTAGNAPGGGAVFTLDIPCGRT